LSLNYPKWYVVVPSYAWASLVGYSRMAIGMHYPSDVLIGALVGSASSFLVYKLRKPVVDLKDKIIH
jgi:membrane-associated phospholipid phosphatase